MSTKDSVLKSMWKAVVVDLSKKHLDDVKESVSALIRGCEMTHFEVESDRIVAHEALVEFRQQAENRRFI